MSEFPCIEGGKDTKEEREGGREERMNMNGRQVSTACKTVSHNVQVLRGGGDGGGGGGGDGNQAR